jgi:hypothetical protein
VDSAKEVVKKTGNFGEEIFPTSHTKFYPHQHIIMPPQRPSTPTQRDELQHYPTPTKAAVRTVVDWYESRGKWVPKQRIFEHFGLSRTRRYALLYDNNARRRQNDPYKAEPRGRPYIWNERRLDRAERLLEHSDGEAHWLTWDQLAYETLEDTESDEPATSLTKTTREALGSRNYHMCVACRKPWIGQKSAKQRYEFAHEMLKLRPYEEDWKEVRFSDECHYNYGASGRAYVIRRPGERLRACCINRGESEDTRHLKRVHTWAAVGYDFKSEIHFYDVGNRNGKMTQAYYKSVILGEIVQSWLDRGDEFVLEEDGDSGHGPRSAQLKTFKEKMGLRYYINCAGSPDLAPIENAWKGPKQRSRSVPHWTQEVLRELVFEGWKDLSQESINRQILDMPRRLRQVAETMGQRAGEE